MIKEANTTFPIHPLIKSRWSPRVFADTPVSDEAIYTLFEAARWAASSMNEQPWRFIYAKRESDAYKIILKHLAEFNQQWVKNAPVIILTAYKEKFNSGKENFHALHDLGLAMGNLSLQAQSMGLAVHHMAGLDWKKLQEIFNVQEGFHITTAVAVGYYGGDPSVLPEDLEESERAPRKRLPLNTLACEGKWIEQ
ncbi:nitroreductase family protein [Fulvivirga sedimenti]|uniref:Nitroreductase family protein n=1 Tax=Fulvivirga sedimenti TaxID=2879465 RepID=A0A9X1KZM9_9BACT|nr:nitroreductase family protein [Fulvivirga sedimenti]MCA6074866.1 nitroreductase family protein [Fulvivirga sedimenti]MCA6076043.1 nitroreductase family protein [Fulvivirga sedimenti]MCA6077171.1 nitroreductase family protein [Fulvivirga sedimenti]